MRETVQKIRTALGDGGIQKQVLAAEAGVHRNSLSDVESDQWNPRLKTLEALSNAVDRIKERRA